MMRMVKIQRKMSRCSSGETQLQALLKANAALQTVQNAVKAGLTVMLRPKNIVAKTKLSIGTLICATKRSFKRPTFV